MKYEITSITDMQNAIDAIYAYCRHIGAGEDETQSFVFSRLALLYAQERAQAMTKKMVREAGNDEAFEKTF